MPPAAYPGNDWHGRGEKSIPERNADSRERAEMPATPDVPTIRGCRWPAPRNAWRPNTPGRQRIRRLVLSDQFEASKCLRTRSSREFRSATATRSIA